MAAARDCAVLDYAGTVWDCAKWKLCGIAVSACSCAGRQHKYRDCWAANDRSYALVCTRQRLMRWAMRDRGCWCIGSAGILVVFEGYDCWFAGLRGAVQDCFVVGYFDNNGC
ncbi:hypothetical protein Acr_12g0002940 [Actinidia rufa]|uniref:Uncharacterized protein n=1 Tax=Actinidia rufa TaxID=165716 RepID=A0A7J0FGN4_9ERIC|nr:hypothetical protein Acr_12g0002940 [Actinidia rufa]